MRVGISCLLLMSIVTVLLAQQAGAMTGPINIGIPYVVGPGFTYGAPFSQGSYVINEFNTNTLVHTDAESMAIALTPQGSGHFGGDLSISPVIAQTCDESLVMDRSYFFNDFFSG